MFSTRVPISLERTTTLPSETPVQDGDRILVGAGDGGVHSVHADTGGDLLLDAFPAR